ncbi:MAG: multiple sugar transport system permease protein [Actinomycetota bacterium]|nr:multiple sugar transport system permease protein [Actinomycetota bacterium]
MNTKAGILFLLPSAIILIVFVAYPIVQSAWMSLHNWSYLQSTQPFIGLQNYIDLGKDPRFWNALGNTAVFSAVTVPLQIVIGMLLAIRFARSNLLGNFFRSVYFFPVISAFATMAIVWKFLLSPDIGPFAAWEHALGIPTVNILQSTAFALPAVIVVGLWKNVGFTMVILIAALQDVPESLNEAAALDGVGTWGRFRYVTLPAIRQPLLFATILAVIASLQVFDQVYVMTGGGPLFHTETLVTYLYQLGFQQYRSGYAAAVAWVLFILIMIVSVVQLRIFRYRDVD